MSDFTTILMISVAAAIASPIGGLVSLWHRPTTLFMSIALGFASEILLATVAFEMMPQALEMGGLALAAAGFLAGFLAVYLFDLFVNRFRLAGQKADQYSVVRRYRRRHPPRGGEATVLAGGTSAEELIEGLSIGVGAAVEPGLGLLIAIAIVVDNLSEGISIGEIVRSEGGGSEQRPAPKERARILGWTGVIGLSLLVAAMVGWFALRDMPAPVLGTLLAAGAGGMFYLTVTDLLFDAEERQYQQSGGLAAAAGFVAIFVVSSVL